MKATGRCPKCQSRRVGHLSGVLDKDEYANTTRSLAVAVRPGRGFFGGDSTDHRAAEVEAYVCTECGYFEEHVRHPESVPWENLKNFRFYEPE